MIPAPASSFVDRAPREPLAPRLPLSRRSRGGDASRLRVVHSPALRGDAATELDRRLRALSGRAARCRLAEGWLAARLLARSGWFSLGFVRAGDYANERLGIGARILEEEARVVLGLRGLPRITAAFLDGTISWTALRLIVAVATPRSEAHWVAQAAALDTRALAAAVRGAAGAGNGKDAATTRSRLHPEDPEDDGGADPERRWTVHVSPAARRLWRAACEMAGRVAGTRLTPAQVLEQVAAEALSGAAGASRDRVDMAASVPDDFRDGVRCSSAVAGAGLQVRAPRAVAMHGGFDDGVAANEQHALSRFAGSGSPRAGLAEFVAAEDARTEGDRSVHRLKFLTVDDARELERRDPQLAAFWLACATAVEKDVHCGDEAGGRRGGASSLEDCRPCRDGHLRGDAPGRPVGLAELILAEDERTAERRCRFGFLTVDDARELEARDPELAAFFASEILGDDADSRPCSSDECGRASADETPPPEHGWFERILRNIGQVENFEWLKTLPVDRPETPGELLEADLRAIEDDDPHTLDARLREVRRAAQAMDFELAALLDEAASRRLHGVFGLASFERYVEDRAGLRARTAWSLLSIGRAVRRSCPLLGEAWKTGRITTLAARILLPVVGTRNGGSGGPDGTDAQWIARASTVTLRRLEAEVSWALDRRDAMAAAAGTGDHGDGLQMRAPADGAPSGVATEDNGLQMHSPDAVTDAVAASHVIAPPPLDLDITGHALAAVTLHGLQMRAHGDGTGEWPRHGDNAGDGRGRAQETGPAAGSADRFGVTVTVFAPESVIQLVEDTLETLRRPGDSRGRAFERMLALAMLEWMSAPRHRDPVFERDGWTCAVPGCRSRRNLHDHHVVFRSHGGDNARDNRITVCAAHHLYGLHRGRIHARGLAPHAMHWDLGIRFGRGPEAGRPLARLVGDRYVERD